MIAVAIALVVAWAAIPAAIYFNFNRPAEGPGERAALHLRDDTTDSDGDGLTDYYEVRRYGTNLSNPDTDGDGMDDAWEVHFGVRDPDTNEWNIDPNDPTDAMEDADGDGFLNIEEYNQGTDPIDPGSHPAG